jgi:hypothetical protein
LGPAPSARPSPGSVLGKLGGANRTEAVTRARQATSPDAGHRPGHPGLDPPGRRGPRPGHGRRWLRPNGPAPAQPPPGLVTSVRGLLQRPRWSGPAAGARQARGGCCRSVGKLDKHPAAHGEPPKAADGPSKAAKPSATFPPNFSVTEEADVAIAAGGDQCPLASPGRRRAPPPARSRPAPRKRDRGRRGCWRTAGPGTRPRPRRPCPASGPRSRARRRRPRPSWAKAASRPSDRADPPVFDRNRPVDTAVSGHPVGAADPQHSVGQIVRGAGRCLHVKPGDAVLRRGRRLRAASAVCCRP